MFSLNKRIQHVLMSQNLYQNANLTSKLDERTEPFSVVFENSQCFASGHLENVRGTNIAQDMVFGTLL